MTLKSILFTALATISATTMAQKKQFTLNDLLSGGSTYYASSYPENKFYTWWGETCVETGVDELKTTDGKAIVSIDALNSVLKANGRRELRTLQYAKFPKAGEKQVLVQTGGELTVIDFASNNIIWKGTIAPNAENIDRHAASMNTAYTMAHNLFVQKADGSVCQVSTDGSLDLVYGESVHRNEFGIEKGTFWSPTGTLLAFYKMDQSMVSKYPQVNILMPDSPSVPDGSAAGSRCATLDPDPYPMAGEASHKVQVGIYDTQTNKTIYLETGDPTDRYFTNIAWSPDETKLYLIELNRDQTDGSLDEYDAATGKKLRTLFTEHNDKYFEPVNAIEFLPWDSSKFIYMTRNDGFKHIYLCDMKQMKGQPFETTAKKQLTRGTFEVFDVLGFNKKAKTIIYTSNELNPLQQNVFAVYMTGKSHAIGNKTGWHTASLSPEGTMLLDKFSSPEVARQIEQLETKASPQPSPQGRGHRPDGSLPLEGRVGGGLLLTAADPWDAFDMPEIKTGSIKAADSTTDLYYRLVLPTGFDPAKKYPTVVYVYGGPHAHIVDASRGWGVRGWDLYMAQRGYIIFSLDNRGSEHRGLAFEQSTFRNLGVEEMKDQLLGVEYLKSLPYVDADRLGVHGWSFGGFMTTSLMCEPNTPFKVGVAGGPVIDWSFYEVMYGERYMDTPQSNPEGYSKTSLLGKAGNLKGRLMVIYGGNDPTCVPQHTLSFMRACIDANTYPDLFTYPGDGHNMFGTDRVHLHEVITRYFDDHLK